MTMAYGQGGTTEQIRGTVEQANEKGLKVGGRWFNWSQYSKVTVRPAEGDDVELEIARGKFINDARILPGGSLAEVSGDEDPFEPLAAQQGSGVRGPAATPPPAAAIRAPERNTEIRRLALIKAAAAYAATRETLAPEDVTAIAAQWEVWVTGQD